MVQLTIEIPEELASRLQPVQDRLLEIVELGLREINPAQYALHSEVVDFLASGPSPLRYTALPFDRPFDKLRRLLKMYSGD
jgi:hypothetical protein